MTSGRQLSPTLHTHTHNPHNGQLQIHLAPAAPHGQRCQSERLRHTRHHRRRHHGLGAAPLRQPQRLRPARAAALRPLGAAQLQRLLTAVRAQQSGGRGGRGRPSPPGFSARHRTRVSPRLPAQQWQ